MIVRRHTKYFQNTAALWSRTLRKMGCSSFAESLEEADKNGAIF